VDNGITAFDPVTCANKLGVDVIITDHHKPHAHRPDAYAIVNPHQDDCPYPFKSFAGVGVTFKILSLLYTQKNLTLPLKVYELLLLGTIADVVPLVGENRFWVRYGLNYVNKNETLSLKVLKQNSKLTKSTLSATDIGFSLTPQINALGRLEDPRQGVKFLIGSDLSETQEVGRILFELNERRKEIELSIIADVINQVEQGSIDLTKENIIIAASKSWPPGVIGLVASRIVARYGKPTILLHITKSGVAKGSCRSIPEFNMFDALSDAQGMLHQFGGHALAAGLALNVDRVSELKAHLEERIARLLTPYDLQPKLRIDASAHLSDLTSKFVDDLHHLEPFGNSNSIPTFYFKNVVLVQKPTLLKDAHVKCMIFADGVIKPVIFFNRPELFTMLYDADQRSLDVVAQVSENHWNGKVNIELMGTDIAFSPEIV
jgi:single-stranded-DNA-specific exonuclease